jgi:hypothetical protein
LTNIIRRDRLSIEISKGEKMAKEDGGPAYPIDAYGESRLDPSWGMSLRDYFAGQALIALVWGSFTEIGQDALKKARDNKTAKGAGEVFAVASYEYADAMLAERDK